MHRKLRERESNPLGIECGIDSLIRIEVNAPVVRTFHPCTNDYIDTAVCQSTQGNERSRFIQNACILCQNGFNDSFHMFIIAAVFHTERPLHTACRFSPDIRNDSAAQGTVRDINIFIVSRKQDSMEYLNFPYRTTDTLRLDIVAYFIRLEQQDDQTTGEVRQVPLNAIPTATPARQAMLQTMWSVRPVLPQRR